MLCAFCVKDPSKYFTNHVEVHLEREIGGKKALVPKEHVHGSVEHEEVVRSGIGGGIGRGEESRDEEEKVGVNGVKEGSMGT